MAPHQLTSASPSSGRPGRSRYAAGLLACALAGLSLASAAPSAAAFPALSPKTPSVPVMVVLDASGSMNETDAPGPRIDAAKKAVTSLVTALPADTDVGLTVYGATTSSSAANKTKGCQDIRTLVPVGPLDPAAMSAAVNSVKASGYTPIGNALRAAAKALPQEGPRSIVLVSDGEDTCAPPAPCDVAKDLKKQGVDLTVHTVGFKVDAKARAQLSCVATATGGTYSDATNADQLTGALKVKVDYAITGYTTKGTKITGADQLSEQAPLLAPGQYLDTFATGGLSDNAAGTTKYYTVPIQQNATLYVSATIVDPGTKEFKYPQQLGVRVALRARDNTQCDYATGTSFLSAKGHGPATAVMDTTFAELSRRASCPDTGVGILEVQRTGLAYANEPVPVEILVRYEPPADTTGVPPGVVTDQPVLAKPQFGPPSTITPGSSFNDAPALTDGVTYAATLSTGEDHYYRIPLEWGQRFSYLVDEDKATGPAGGSHVNVGVDFFNPLRQSINTSGSTSAFWFTESDFDPLTGSSNVPVRYSNRSSYFTRSRHYEFDGSYYLRLSADRDPKKRTTPYRILVTTSGIPEAGPRYLSGPVGATTAPGGPTTTATSLPDVSQTTAGAPASTAVDVSASQTSTEAGGVSALTIALILVAAVGGAGLAVVVLVARSRRATSSTPQGPQT